jgi:hypothetical protein
MGSTITLLWKRFIKFWVFKSKKEVASKVRKVKRKAPLVKNDRVL